MLERRRQEKRREQEQTYPARACRSIDVIACISFPEDIRCGRDRQRMERRNRERSGRGNEWKGHVVGLGHCGAQRCFHVGVAKEENRREVLKEE